MSDTHPLEQAPKIQVKLELVPSLAHVCEPAGPVKDVLSRAIGQQVDQLSSIIGVPGKTAVEIGVLESPHMSGEQFFLLYVHGQRIRYPDELTKWVYSYVTHSLANSATSLPAISEWLAGICHDGRETTRSNFSLLVEFFSLTCLEAIRCQPELLMDLPQAEAYRVDLLSAQKKENAETSEWPPSTEWLLKVMKKVISLGISIADIRRVSDKLREKVEPVPEDAAESLIESLRPDALEIHLPEEYLRKLTLADPEKDEELFPFMRDGLFVELGITYPPFRFVIDKSLKPGSFAVKINHLLRVPKIGLQPDQCLVNDSLERLKVFQVEAMEATNPANQLPASIASLRYKPRLEEAGWTTWNIFGYLILCLAAELRKNSWCLTDQQVVQKSLEKLEMGFPALVSSVKAEYALELITRLLRALVAEEQSIRNLRLILERLLDYPYATDDRMRYLVLDDRPNAYGSLEAIPAENFARLVAFVRAELKGQISNKHARGINTLVAYLLDAKIERMVSRWDNEHLDADSVGAVSSDEADKIIEAIRSELAYLPATAMVPAILTSIEARPGLRRVLQHEFPRIPVIAYHELMPNLNVQPIARISLPT